MARTRRALRFVGIESATTSRSAMQRLVLAAVSSRSSGNLAELRGSACRWSPIPAAARAAMSAGVEVGGIERAEPYHDLRGALVVAARLRRSARLVEVQLGVGEQALPGGDVAELQQDAPRRRA